MTPKPETSVLYTHGPGIAGMLSPPTSEGEEKKNLSPSEHCVVVEILIQRKSLSWPVDVRQLRVFNDVDMEAGWATRRMASCTNI